MLKIFRAAALSAIVGLGALAAAPAPAEASGFGAQIGFANGNTAVSFRFGDGGRHHARPGAHYRGGQCTAREAVHKASRLGIRNARVVRADRRTVQVRGQQRGPRPAAILFANARGCPVIR